MSAENPKILLVDDDRDLLQLVGMRLTAAGYAVTAVESGEAALSALSVSRPQVVVTDLRMAGMDGMALFDAIHRDSPSLPVVILTAHGTIPEAVMATRRGDRKSTRLNSSHSSISYAVFCLKKKKPSSPILES